MSGEIRQAEDAIISFCPNCGIGHLRTWRQLSEEEKVVNRQRPSPDGLSLEHRQEDHLWCMHCGYEICQMKQLQRA